MKLIYLENPDQVNNFVKQSANSFGAEFLQSYDWGEILVKEEDDILRLGVVENDQLLAVATLVKKIINNHYFYWYCPRGPLGQIEAIKFLISKAKKIDKQALFLRIEPKQKIIGQETIAVQPKKTLFLDLEKSESELLKEMHQKTRYNIRLAEKKGVKIIEGDDKDFSEFWRLMELTGQRDSFRLHQAKHYQTLLTASNNKIKLFFGQYQDKNIVAGMFSFWGDKVTYLHGASDNKFRNVMAPYLLHWEIIKKAKKAQYKHYDFFGIDEQKWPGVSRFKLGFGGKTIKYPGTFDVVFKPILYNLYNLMRKLKRLW